MNDIFSYYTKYRAHVDEYNRWNQEADKGGKSSDNLFVDRNLLKQRAKAIAEPILLIDKYEHEKAEDSETFFQTCNIELMSLTTAIVAFPSAITKLIPFLNRHANSNSFIKKSSELLTKYKDSTINIASKSIKTSKALTFVSAIIGGLFFANGIKKSMQSQLGLIRKASFDATQNIVDNPNMFAVLTPEQQAQVQKIVNDEEAQKSLFVEKLKDKVNISTSFESVNDYKKNHSTYLKSKNDYFKKLQKEHKPNNLTPASLKAAREDKVLFENLLKNVEHDVLEPLRKVETVSNVTYSAMFTGGYLEYLISDKLVSALGVKNKVLSAAMKFGVPLLTYLLLNKNISDIENRAILATKYKHLRQFTEHPEQYENPQRHEKQSPIEFIRTLFKDMSDYDKFAEKELPKIEENLTAKKQIKLSPEQQREAKRLQKNTSMVINTQREKLYEQSVGIKSLSETILGPLDIIATATGGFIGSKLSKNCKNKKLAGMLSGIGAIVAFIPAAIVEAKLTKQQKFAEKTSVMMAIKDLQDVNKFADIEPDFVSPSVSQHSKIFNDFIV